MPRVSGTEALHLYLMELEAEPATLERLAELIDRDIAAQNGDYAAHRSSSVGLARPVIAPVRRGTFHAFMRERGKLGGQHKVPRVLTSDADRKWFEAILRGGSSDPSRPPLHG